MSSKNVIKMSSFSGAAPTRDYPFIPTKGPWVFLSVAGATDDLLNAFKADFRFHLGPSEHKGIQHLFFRDPTLDHKSQTLRLFFLGLCILGHPDAQRHTLSLLLGQMDVLRHWLDPNSTFKKDGYLHEDIADDFKDWSPEVHTFQLAEPIVIYLDQAGLRVPNKITSGEALRSLVDTIIGQGRVSELAKVGT